MTSWILPLVISAGLLGQSEEAEKQPGLREVRLAVQRLGDRDFATREEAYRFLWTQGLSAKPELERALKSRDGEVRARARRLLNDFEYGILPGTPRGLLELIRNFRDGTDEVRQQAYQRLLDDKEFKTVERLIRLERQPESRRSLLAQLVQHPQAVEAFIELDRIETLLEAVASDQDAEWRKLVSIQLMFAPKVMEHLAAKKQLDGVLKLIQDEKQADARQRMLAIIFQNATTVAAVIEHEQLSFLFAAIKAEPDHDLRGVWLATLVSNQAAAQKLVEQDKVGEVLEFAEAHIAVDSAVTVFERILQSPAITQAMLKEGGVDRLIALVSREKDAAKRGRLMAAAIASPAIRGQLQGRALADLIIAAAKKEKEATTRREMLLALLENNNIANAFSDAATMHVVWRFVREDDDRAWQARAIAFLLRGYRSYQVLGDREEAAWLLQLVDDEAAAPVREELLLRLLSNPQIHDMLIGQGHVATLLTFAKGMPDTSRGQVLQSLAASQALGQELVAKGEADLLITLVKEEKLAAARSACLRGVLRNNTAMPQLIQKGHYETLRELIETEEDLQQRGNLWGDFVNANGILDEIIKRQATELLLTSFNIEHEGVRSQFRVRLFQNVRAIGLLVEQGKYDELLALARLDDGALLDEFLAVPQVIERLLTKKEFREVFSSAVKQGTADTRRQMLQRMFYNGETLKKLIAGDEFEHVFALIASEPESNWRVSLLSPVLASPEVIRYFAEKDKLQLVFDLIATEPEPSSRNQLLSYLTSRTDVLSMLIEQGQLNTLLAALKKYADGGMRGDLLGRVLIHPKTLQQLKADERLGTLLDFAHSTEESDDAVRAYANVLFGNDNAITMLIADGQVDSLWASARRQPDQRRGDVLARLAASRSVATHLHQTGTLHWLVELVRNEKHEPAQLACIRGLFSNAEAMQHLLKGDTYQALRSFIDQQADAEQRATLLGDFLNANTAPQQMAAHKELDLLLEYAEHENEAVRKQFRPRLFRNPQALTLLFDAGHFDKLVALAKEEKRLLLAQLLAVPKAIELLIAAEQFDVLLGLAAEQADTNVRSSLLQSLVYNRTVLQTLIAHDHIDAILRLIQEERQPFARASLLSSLLATPDVMRHYVKAGKLDSIFKLLAANSTPNSSNSVLASVLGRYDVITILVENDGLEDAISSVQDHTSGAARGQLLGTLLTNSKSLEWLKKNKKTGLLMSLAGAEHEDAAAHQAYLLRLFAHSNVFDLLIADGHFDKLLELVTKQPDQTRGTALRTFLANRSVAQYLDRDKHIDRLLNLVIEEEHLPTRQAALGGLLNSSTAMPKLLEAGHYATLKKEVEAVADPVQRGVLFGDFLRARGVLDELVKQGEVESLLKYAEVEDDSARKQFLTRLFQNRNAIGLLIDKGHYEKLLTLSRQDTSLMGVFLSVPQVVKHLAATKQLDVLFTFLAETSEDNARRTLLQQIVHTEESVKLIVEADEFPKLLKLVASDREGSYRGSSIGTLLASPSVLQHLAENDQFDLLNELMSAEADPMIRSQIVSSLFNRSNTIEVFAANNKLDAAVTLVLQHVDANSRGPLLARVLTNQKSLEQLKADKKVDLLLSVAEGLTPESAQAYLGQLFAYSHVLSLLLDQGHYPKLAELAMSNAGVLLPRLFANGKAVNELLKSEQLPVLVTFAKTTDDNDRRRSYLALLFGNDQLVEALSEQKLLGDLMELCRSEPDEKLRNNNFVTLLLSPASIDRLEAEELTRIVKLAATDADAANRQRFLNDLFARAPAVAKLVEKGHFETLFNAATSDLNDSSRYSIVSRVLNNREAVAGLAASGQSAVVLKMVTDLPDARMRNSLMQQLLHNAGFTQAVVEAGKLDVVLEQVEVIETESMRRSALGALFGSRVVLASLVKQDQLRIVFDRIEKEQDDNLRQRVLQALVYNSAGSPILADAKIADDLVRLLNQIDERRRLGYVYRFVNDTPVRQNWVAAGKVAQLLEIAAMYPEAKRDWARRQVLYSPSGLFGHLVVTGKWDEAEQLLRDADGDEGITQLVAYLDVEHRLDDETAKVRQRYDAEPNAKDARLLVYLLRAQGKIAAARQIAESIDDPVLLRLLLVEERDWPRAAVLQADSIPLSQADPLKHVENLGLLAAYQHLGGDVTGYVATIKLIQEYAAANRDNVTVGWQCAEVLFLNGEPETALAITDLAKPVTAMNLHLLRHEYDQALAVLGWKDDSAIDLPWYEALPSEGSSPYQTQANRFHRALQIAATLRTAERVDESERVLQFLTTFATEAPTNGSPNREGYLRQLSGGLSRMGLVERSLTVGALSVGTHTSYANVLNDLYGTEANEARHWWSLLHAANKDEDPETRLRRIHQLMRPGSSGPPDDFDELFDQTQQRAATYHTDTASYWHAIGTTCRRLGRNDAAEVCFAKVPEYLPAMRALADLFANQQRWDEAAAQYEAVWQFDHQQVGALYLASDALRQYGHKERANELQILAQHLAVEGLVRHRLAVDLDERGLRDEAAEQLELLVKFGGMGSWELNDAARRLADRTSDDAPARKADLWQHYLFGTFAHGMHFLQDVSYLRMPALLHKMRLLAAIQDEQWDVAEAELTLAQRQLPGETPLVEEVVPRFDAAGQTALGDAAVDRLVQHYQSATDKYPRMAYLHNNLAWAAARCHRRLDDALAHAEKAVELTPDHAGHIDTLAEVHFHRGDREQAIRFSQKSLELRPGDANLKRQLQRFRDDPLPEGK
ncbi:MAG: hypothetical protein KDB05_26080 [Planctomycetales bacterium]|nr:hypothetical protein [Planctomycetales bacterium]